MKSWESGFTLAELLITITILGVIAALAGPYYFKTIEQARSREALAHLYTIHRAEKVYQVSNGQYWPIGPGGGAKDTSVGADFTQIKDNLNIDIFPQYYRIVITSTVGGAPALATGFGAVAYRDNAGNKQYAVDAAGTITESGAF